jgi:hypothetical protein
MDRPFRSAGIRGPSAAQLEPEVDPEEAAEEEMFDGKRRMPPIVFSIFVSNRQDDVGFHLCVIS